MRADAGIEADTIDDGLGIETLHLGIGVELVEVGDAKGQVGVGEEFDGLGLGGAHEKDRHILLDGTFDEEGGEGVGGCFEGGIIIADDDAGGIEIVIEGLGLAEELGSEDDLRGDDLEGAVGETLAIAVFLTDTGGVAHGDCALDDHHSIGVHGEHEVDNILDMVSIEEVLDGIVVCGGCNDHEVCVLVGSLAIKGCHKIQLLLLQILLDILILNGANPVVDLLHLLRDDIDGGHLMMLRQQGSDGKTYIACACNCDFHILTYLYLYYVH